MADDATRLIHNEKQKLIASALDRLSTTFAAVGIVGPVATLLYGSTGVHAPAVWLFMTFLAWSLMALALHSLAREALEKLR
ncbi:MAG: hypothetical protein ACTHJ3_04820 [Pararhizobium sp.]